MQQKQQFTVEYLTVSLFDKVKRLYNPSKDLRCLANQIKSTFKELERFVLVDSEEPLDFEFNIQWLTSDQLIVVSDNDQLEEIYIMHIAAKSKNTSPRFQVNARREDLKQAQLESGREERLLDRWQAEKDEIMADAVQSQFKSCFPSQSAFDSGNLADRFQAAAAKQSHILDDIASQKSEDMEDAKSEDLDGFHRVEESKSLYDSEDSSSDDEEKDDRKFLQSLRHFIRLEVEKNVFALIENEPELKAISEELKKQAQEDERQPLEEFHDAIENVENNDDNIEYSQHIDVTVNLTNEKANNQVGQELRQSRFQPILSTFKSFFQKKVIPSDKRDYAVIVGQTELFIEEAKINDYTTLKWTVQNKTKVAWPVGIQLVLVYSQPLVLIENQPITQQLAPGDTYNISVNLFIPRNIKALHQIVMFRLRSQQGFIGDPLIGFIRIQQDAALLASSSSVRASQQIQASQVRKSSLQEDFSDLSDEKLLGMASILVDEGFGTFDRCYSMIRALRGSMTNAKENLSQLMFYECQF